MVYKVVKIFNNNVILARRSGQEVMLVGKGIGFGKKSGDEVSDPKSIEKVFHSLESKSSQEYLDMIPKYKEEVVGVSVEIIAKAEAILGSLSPNIHTALVDHITFALDRIKMNLPIENPFTQEITLLYQEEYEVAELAATLLKDRLGVDIGDDEKGFITLHLHSARSNKTIRETMKDTRLFKSCIDLVVEEIDSQYINKSHAYESLISSLKIALSFWDGKKAIKNPLKKEIENKLCHSYSVAKKIARLIERDNNIILSKDMIAYIAIDIERIKQF